MKTFLLTTTDASEINLAAAMDMPGYDFIQFGFVKLRTSFYPFETAARNVVIKARCQRDAISEARKAMFSFSKISP